MSYSYFSDAEHLRQTSAFRKIGLHSGRNEPTNKQTHAMIIPPRGVINCV